MISLCRHLLAVSCATAALALITGCSSISSGRSIRETELEIVPTEPSASFSSTAQGEISRLNLTSEQLGDPEELEVNEQVTGGESSVQRFLLLSEAWCLRGQNDLEVPLPVSLERFLRAAHYAYEGIFGASGCQDPGAPICRDLTNAYNRSVREIARLTHNGTHTPPPGESRYIVDLEADNDPLTLSEWEVVLSDDAPAPTATALGASGTGCQELADDSKTGEHTARRCVPLAFLVTFDARVTEHRSRAHLSAFDTLERNEIQLHDRTTPLASRDIEPWTEIFAPGDHKLSCLGNAHPALPTVIFLTPTTELSYEWPVIGAAIAKDSVLRDHYNFCVLPTSQTTQPTPPAGEIDAIAGSLTTLMPKIASPAQVVVIAQGPSGEGVAKALKDELKGVVPGATPPLAVAGTLSIPALRRFEGAPPPAPIYSINELSRAGTTALSDTKRLLSRLAHDDDRGFGDLTRSALAPSGDERISPVM